MIARHSTIRPGSAIHLARRPEEARWGLDEQLLAGMLDALHVLAWRQTSNGQKGISPPERIPRPGVVPNQDTTVIGSDPRPLEDVKAWLTARNPAQHAA